MPKRRAAWLQVGRIADDDDWLTSQPAVVPLLHRRKEGIHVHVDDLAEFGTVF